MTPNVLVLMSDQHRHDGRTAGVVDGAVVDGMVEHVDVPATIRAAADAADLPDSEGRSLLGHLDAPGGGFTRDVIHSENWGFGLVATDRYKVVVDESRGVPVQCFDLEADPDEERDLVDDGDFAPTLAAVMDDVVGPFYADGVFQPVSDANFVALRRSMQEAVADLADAEGATKA